MVPRPLRRSTSGAIALVCSLLAQYAHDLYNSVCKTLLDVVHAADAAPVTFADIVKGLVPAGLCCDVFETSKEGVEVPVGLRRAVLSNAVPVNSLEIG